VRILLKKTQEGWKVRFPSGNPWKMPVAEWLSVTGNFHEAPAHIVTAHLMAAFQSSNVFTLCPIGEDLEQVDHDEQAAWQQGKLSESNLNQTEFGPLCDRMTTRAVSTDGLQRLVQSDFTEPSAVLMR
jgi:hypothetical protein